MGSKKQTLVEPVEALEAALQLCGQHTVREAGEELVHEGGPLALVSHQSTDLAHVAELAHLRLLEHCPAQQAEGWHVAQSVHEHFLRLFGLNNFRIKDHCATYDGVS